MKQVLRRILGVFALLTVVTGVLYPLVVFGIAQAVFPFQANGSVIVRDGAARGSALLGQPFSSDRYFHGRPSATGPVPYNGAASTGTNHGPLNPALAGAVCERIAVARAANGADPVPVDLVTASGSGLDPHVTPAAARHQLSRVARVRGLPVERVAALLDAHTEGRTLGVLGEPRVNVLALNLALDALDALE